VTSNTSLEHLQRLYILSLAKHRVCQVSNQYGEEKKGYLQWFGKIELAKPKVWTQRLLFYAKTFFASSTRSRVFLRALFLAPPPSSFRSCVHLKEDNRLRRWRLLAAARASWNVASVLEDQGDGDRKIAVFNFPREENCGERGTTRWAMRCQAQYTVGIYVKPG